MKHSEKCESIARDNLEKWWDYMSKLAKEQPWHTKMCKDVEEFYAMPPDQRWDEKGAQAIYWVHRSVSEGKKIEGYDCQVSARMLQ